MVTVVGMKERELYVSRAVVVRSLFAYLDWQDAQCHHADPDQTALHPSRTSMSQEVLR